MATRLVLAENNVIMNYIVLDDGAEYDPTPFHLAPKGAEGEIGTVYVEDVK